MPIYEYICKDCGQELEKIQKINEAALVDCPSCGKLSLRKKISAAGFQLKGTGWYATDFKDKPKTPAPDVAKTEEKKETNPASPQATTPKEAPKE